MTLADKAKRIVNGDDTTFEYNNEIFIVEQPATKSIVIDSKGNKAVSPKMYNMTDYQGTAAALQEYRQNLLFDKNGNLIDKFKKGKKIKSHIYKRGEKINRRRENITSDEPTDEDYRDMHDTFSLRENYPHGRTPQWIWDNWTEEQRFHFLTDHDKKMSLEIANDLKEEPYENLTKQIKRLIENHVSHGRYENGTKIESQHERNENYYENVVNELLNDNAIATIRMKTYGCEIMSSNNESLPIKLTRSDMLALIIKSNVEFMNYDEKQITNEIQSMIRLLMKK